MRLRLVVLVILLGGAALAVADVVVYRALDRALVDQRDDQIAGMVEATGRFTAALEPPLPGPTPIGDADPADAFAGREPPNRLLPDGSIALTIVDGEVTRSIDLADPSAEADPELVAALLQAADRHSGSFGFRAGGISYRAHVVALDDGSASAMAVPSDDIADTLDDLLRIEAAATLVALAVLAAAAWWVVGLGLRPLDQMAATAEQIASGDLSQRTPVARGNSEVARLGRSFNTMLGSIEEAFDERQRAEDRLRRFVGDASHELRTPLTSVRGYADLIRRGAVSSSSDVVRSAERIEQQADRMGELIDELLLLAQLDEDRPLERSTVDLSSLTGEAVDDFHSVDPTRPFRVEAEQGIVVSGDAGRLRRVIDNLLENARRHTPATTPIEMRLGRRDGEAVLIVADEGPGLDAHDAARVFDRFYRADASRARTTGGTGLGLSIVAAVVEEHGGRIHLDTAPGQGCRFEISLPLADASTGPRLPADPQVGLTVLPGPHAAMEG